VNRRARLGVTYLGGVERRQVRVGKHKEPVAVLRLVDDAKAGEEIVLTRRMMRFLVDGLAYEGLVIEPLMRHRSIAAAEEREP
jgi:hypothetical protein